MRQRKTQCRVLGAALVVLVCCTMPAFAQDVQGHCVSKYCSFTHTWVACNAPCYIPRRPVPYSQPSGPSSAEIEAERKREAEEKHLEALQRQAEIERQRQEAERKRAQEEFAAEVRKAAGELKGVSHDQMGLKGVGGDTHFFGLKDVSPNKADANIKNTRPDYSYRDVSTASKQLTCAADITSFAFKHVSNIVAGEGTVADMDEIKYLAGEAANALQGDPVGVQCKSSGLLKFTKAPDLKAITPAYKRDLGDMVRDSKRLYQTNQQAVAAQQNVDEANGSVEDLRKQKDALLARRRRLLASRAAAKPQRSAGESDVDKAYAEQKAWQQKDQERINQVYQKQKKLQQQQLDALALLRKAQADLNAVNSQKIRETRAVTQDVKSLATIETGNVPRQ